MEGNGRIDPCETEIKNLRGGGEVNTYDSPIDPLSFSDKQNLSRKSKKGILSGIYKFAATSIVILTVIFAASELLDFIISDMGAENTILRRIFGSSASGEDGNLIELILEQTFGELPIKPSKTSAIQGMNFSKAAKCSAKVCTQSQPISGMMHWKKEKMPAMLTILVRLMQGSLSPLARETEKASMASPIPIRILLKKNEKLHIKIPLYYHKSRLFYHIFFILSTHS